MTSRKCGNPSASTRKSHRGPGWGLVSIVLLVSQLATFPTQAADIMVGAAASLTNAFTDIGKAYEKATPGTRVLFNFASSGQLLQQISRGAPVDVFATADLETMDRAENQGLIVPSSRVNFAANKLVVVVPGDSKLEISKLQDLTSPQVQRIALGTPGTGHAGL